eukprot:11783693-Ditylum_brightwellii.AAC.1
MSTRLINSYCSSLLHPLGILVNDKLKITTQDILTFIKDLKMLKDELTHMAISTGCKIVIADAKSMYTNIKTSPALNKI